MPKESFQGLDIAAGEIHVFLGPRHISVLNRLLRLEQVCFHARLPGYHIATKTIASSPLLLLQTIQAAVYSSGAVGELVNFALQLIQLGRTVCAILQSRTCIILRR